MTISFIVKQYVPPPPPEPESDTFTISSSADDGGCAYNTNFYNNSSTRSFGWDYPCVYYCFYPTIPNGSTINSCTFTCTTDNAGWGANAPDVYLRFINEDNPAQPIAANATSKTTFQNYSKTGYTLWLGSTMPNMNVNGVVRTTPDMKSILQTVVDRAGWASGNRLILYFGGPNANIYGQDGNYAIKMRQYDYGSSFPSLYVNWTPPA